MTATVSRDDFKAVLLGLTPEELDFMHDVVMTLKTGGTSATPDRPKSF